GGVGERAGVQRVVRGLRLGGREHVVVGVGGRLHTARVLRVRYACRLVRCVGVAGDLPVSAYLYIGEGEVVAVGLGERGHPFARAVVGVVDDVGLAVADARVLRREIGGHLRKAITRVV